MTDTITLNCLIQGDILPTDVFSIDIDNNKTVSHLIIKIKDITPRTFGNVDVRDIRIWKVDIPLKSDESNSDNATNKLASLKKGTDIAQELGGMKLLSINKISDVFVENTTEGRIHILIEQPYAEQSRELSKMESYEMMGKILQNTETIMDSLENLHTKVNGLQRIIFQLHEDTIPRLFVILPEDGIWDFKADVLFSRSYRLYFLCEHKRVLPNGEEESQVHLAKHEGYKVRQPRQFMEKYGPYIMQIMPYIKIAIYVAQTSLELAPFVGGIANKLLETGDNICDTALSVADSPILNKEYMHRKALEMCASGERLITASNYQTSRLGSVSRPDLRALQKYLHGVDTYNSLGRLQRVLSKNDVLWVCEAHASACYANDSIKEAQRIISGSSMKGKVFFDSETYELSIKGLDKTSLASLSRQLKPHLEQIPLMKITFESIQKAGVSLLDIDFKTLLDAASTIRVLCFINCTFQSSMLKSPTLHYLQELHLEGIIDSSEARNLSGFLERAKSLTKLALYRNNIGDSGMIALADFLQLNTTLTQLNLFNNSIGENGMIALANSLKHNSTLTHLDLYNNNIEENGIIALADSLKHNSTLTQLGLHSNRLGENGMKALANSLIENSSLTQLNLGGDSIRESGGVALAESLKQNTTLTQLNLFLNTIGENGAIALADSLKWSSALIELGLEGNRIGNNGAIALAESLKQNCILTQLNLRANGIGEEGIIALADSLKQNSILSQLDIRGNDISNGGRHAFNDIKRQGFKCLI